jgi:hypothetical protein
MTVPSSTRSVTYTGNGVTTEFSVSFPFLDNDHIVATQIIDDVETELVEGEDYELEGAGEEEGGTLTMTEALADGAEILIERVVPLTQETEFRAQGAFSAALHERALDKGVMAAQQIQDALDDLEEDLQAQIDEINEVLVAGEGGDPDELEVTATGSSEPRALAERFAEVFNVKGDGSTDDTTAVSNTQGAAGTTTPAIIYFPPGTYMFSGNGLVARAASGSVFRGAGKHVTTIKAKATITNWLVQTSGSYVRQNLTFEDMTFDAGGNGLGILVTYGAFLQGVTFRRCRFLCDDVHGVILNATPGAVFEDCDFHGYAEGGNGLQINDGSDKVVLRRCRFTYFENGVIVDTGAGTVASEETTDHFTIEDCHFDGGWYVRPSVKSNSGGTVTYSATVLTDSAGGFNALGLSAFDRVRILTSRRTGTLTTVGGTYLTDSGANFSACLRGEIVRSGTKFAIITGYDETATTRLNVEEWLDSTTFLPTSPPAAGAAYTAYKILTAAILSNTDTTLTSYDGFYDLNGATATPTAGDLYEVFFPGVYNLHIDYAARNVRIAGCKFLRGWADQCSVYCNRATIVDNQLEYGQDMGITLNGTTGEGYSTIARNRAYRQGMAAIFVGVSENIIVAENQVIGNTWVNHVNEWTAGGIQLYGVSDALVVNNMCDGQGRTLSRTGIGVHGDSVTNNKVTIAHNTCVGFSLGGIVLYGTLITNHRIYDNPHTSIVHQLASGGAGAGTPAGGYYGTLFHSDLGVVGTPEGAVIAGVGTEFVASTGARYYKASGTSNAGWVVLSGANTGDITLAAAVGSSPAAPGASLSGQVLTIQPANATHGGALSNTTQDIPGAKTAKAAWTFESTIDSANAIITPNAGNISASTVYNGRLKHFTLARTVNFGTFKAAANQENVLLFQLPAKTKLRSIIVDTTIAFTGNGSTYNLLLGTSGGGNQLILSHSVLSTVTKGLADGDLGASIARAAATQGGLIISWTATGDIYCQLASDANLGNGTTTNLLTGSFTVYLEYSSF